MRTLILAFALALALMQVQNAAFAADELTADDTRAVNFVTRKPSSLEVAEQKAMSATLPREPIKAEVADNETEGSFCALNCALTFHSTQPLHPALSKIPIATVSK